MAVPSFAGRALLGCAVAAGFAALATWLGGSPPLGRLLSVVLVAALLGGLAGWWLDHRHDRPLRRLRRRLSEMAEGGEPTTGPITAPADVAELATAIDEITGALRRRAAQCEGERVHLEEVLRSMSDGVLVTDRENRVELVNRSFNALFAVSEPLAGQTVGELVRSPELAEFIERLDPAGAVSRQRMESDAGRTVELRGRRLAGDHAVVVAHDLTEPLRLDATIRDLVANVSHELRTPLTAIRGYAENLNEGALDQREVASRFVSRILAQCRRLDALLEDLLALSRIERAEEITAAGALTSVDLNALAKWAVETVSGLAEERRVDLRFTSRPSSAIVGSEEALEAMLLNLLENAIKYNRAGGSVTLSIVPRDGQVVVEVADTGIGMPRRDLQRIFERFYRVDRGRSRTEGGTGLGLAIVKHAAQLHGGSVEVESEIGRGSVFRVHLPAAG